MAAAPRIGPGEEDNHVRKLTVAQALNHPLRVRMLMRMNAPERLISPKEFSEETGELLGTCSYHFRQLERAGCVEIVKEERRRGATEHYYAPVKRAMAWTKEWESLGPVVRQTLAASLLRGGVERIGNAIDAGTFDARDSIMVWDTAWVDEEGWQELHSIFKRAVEECLIAAAESTERCRDLPPDQRMLITFLTSVFESPSEGESML